MSETVKMQARTRNIFDSACKTSDYDTVDEQVFMFDYTLLSLRARFASVYENPDSEFRTWQLDGDSAPHTLLRKGRLCFLQLLPERKNHGKTKENGTSENDACDPGAS